MLIVWIVFVNCIYLLCIKIDLFEFLIFMFYFYELFIGCSISFLFYIGEIESYFGKGGGEEGFLDIKKVGGLL